MKNRFTPFIPVYIILYIFITALQVNSSTVAGGLPQSIAEEVPQFYTIQAGSYRAEDWAQKKYQDLADTLLDDRRDYLRIERVGSYYTIRLGRFGSRDAAEELLGQVEELLPGAVILQAYIKDERILAMVESAIEAVVVSEQVLQEFLSEQKKIAEEQQPEEKPAEDTSLDVEPVREVDIAEVKLPEADSIEPVDKIAPDVPPTEDLVDVPTTKEVLPEKVDVEVVESPDASAIEPTIAIARRWCDLLPAGG